MGTNGMGTHAESVLAHRAVRDSEQAMLESASIRSHRDAELRDRILRAVVSIAAREGYAKASVTSISAAARVSGPVS